MKNGIAIYPGLDNTKEENIALIEAAAKAGLTRLFTSLQIPETDVEKMKAELSETLQTARDGNHLGCIPANACAPGYFLFFAACLSGARHLCPPS